MPQYHLFLGLFDLEDMSNLSPPNHSALCGEPMTTHFIQEVVRELSLHAHTL